MLIRKYLTPSRVSQRGNVSGPLRKQIEGLLAEGEGNISVKMFFSNVDGSSFTLPDSILQGIKFKAFLLLQIRQRIYLSGLSLRMELSLSLRPTWLLKVFIPWNLILLLVCGCGKLLLRQELNSFFGYSLISVFLSGREVLGSRGFNLKTTCELCGMAPETIIHVLRERLEARKVWRGLGVNGSNKEFYGLPLVDWLKI